MARNVIARTMPLTAVQNHSEPGPMSTSPSALINVTIPPSPRTTACPRGRWSTIGRCAGRFCQARAKEPARVGRLLRAVLGLIQRVAIACLEQAKRTAADEVERVGDHRIEAVLGHLELDDGA